MTQAKRNSELIKMVSLCKDDWRVSTLDLGPVLTLDQDTRTDLGHSPSPEVPLNSGPLETSLYVLEAGEAGGAGPGGVGVDADPGHGAVPGVHGLIGLGEVTCGVRSEAGPSSDHSLAESHEDEETEDDKDEYEKGDDHDDQVDVGQGILFQADDVPQSVSKEACGICQNPIIIILLLREVFQVLICMSSGIDFFEQILKTFLKIFGRRLQFLKSLFCDWFSCLLRPLEKIKCITKIL